MSESSDELTAISVRNQILLERLKSGEYKKFAPFLRRIERGVRNRIGDEGDTIATKKRLNVLLTDVQRIQKEIYDEYIAQLNGDLGSIAVSQSEFEANSYNKVVANYNATVPAAEQVLAAVRLNPMQIENYAGVPLLESFMKDWTKKETVRVTSAIQQGYYQGLTNSEIVRSIRGTKANNYRDGLLDITNRGANTMVRTSVQHAASQAQQAAMKANSDLVKGYKIVVTFDSRTTNLCRSLGQLNETYEIGKGPTPPLHNGCRDAISAVLSEKFDFLDEGATRASKGAEGGEQVDAKLGSYDWLKTQPESFQDAAIGPVRGKLLRDGGLTSTEYARLSLSKSLDPLTLDEMRKLSPSAFERAGI